MLGALGEGRRGMILVLKRIAWAGLLAGAVAFMLAQPLQARSCSGGRIALSAGRSFLSAAQSRSPAAFSRALRRHVAMRSIAFFALGRYRRKLPRKAHGRFVRLSTLYVSRKLASYAGGFRGGSVDVTRCRGNVVETRIAPSGQRVVWRIGGGRVVDVKIRGVWLGLALRDHYAALIRQAGGDMIRFMALLK